VLEEVDARLGVPAVVRGGQRRGGERGGVAGNRVQSMGCFRLCLQLIVTSTICAYVLMQALIIDWRDGVVSRIGVGKPRKFTATGVSGGSRIIKLPSGAAMHALEGPADPRMSFLLVHDLAGHGGAMADVALALFKKCQEEGFVCAIYAVDLPGHGYCGDSCGHFTMQQMVDTVREASAWIRNHTSEGAVFTIGEGLGSDVALHAGSGFEAITGTITNGMILPAEVELRPQISLFRGLLGELLTLLMGTRQVCAAAFFNFERFFDKVECIGQSSSEDACIWKHDADRYEAQLRDPHSQVHVLNAQTLNPKP
jgi:hypothetical protein